MRADAIKNRESILHAARIEVESSGTTFSMDSVAKRAGVGPGTLYRHFPTRDELLSELLQGWTSDVQADADATTADQWEDVLNWLARLANHSMIYRGLASTIASTEGDESSPLRTAHAAVLAANAQVFNRARVAGVVAGPVDSAEISRLVSGVAVVAEQAHLTPSQSRSMLAIVLNGLTQPYPRPETS